MLRKAAANCGPLFFFGFPTTKVALPRDAPSLHPPELLLQIHMLYVFDTMPQESLTQAAEFLH